MEDTKPYINSNNQTIQLSDERVDIESSVQNYIEQNMRTVFGIKFIESEYSTGNNHAGFIDSLGIDKKYNPVIFKYQRSINDNVIKQGLLCLDWLMDHKETFELLVTKKFGKEISKKIEWLGTRLLCIADDFSKYDQYVVKQLNRNIELIKYNAVEEDIILFELVNYHD